MISFSLLHVIIAFAAGAALTFIVLQLKFIGVRRNLGVVIEAEKAKSIEMMSDLRASVEKERQAFQQEITAAGEEVTILQERLKEVEDEALQVREENVRAAAEAARESRDTEAETDARLVQLQEELGAAREEFTVVTEALRQAEEQNAALEEQMAALAEADKTAAAEGYDEITGFWGDAKEDVSGAESLPDAAGQENTTALASSLEEKEAALEKLRLENRRLEQGFDAARQEIAELHGELDFLKGEIKNLEKARKEPEDDDYLVFTPGSHYIPGSVARALMGKKKR